MTPKKIHLLVAGREASFSHGIEAAFANDESLVWLSAPEGLHTFRSLSAGAVPDVAVVHVGSQHGTQLESIAQFARRFPGVPVILICDKKDPDLMVQALHVGVKEFLFEPVTSGDLQASVRRLASTRHGGDGGGAAGKVLAVIACKGGSGATFLATNLAHLLADAKHKRVLLLDLNLLFGDAYLFVMDQVPLVTLADVCSAFSRLDASFLESAVAKLPSGLHVLAAPATPEEGDLVKAEHVEGIIRLARAMYDFVVVDVGRSFDSVSLKALDLADQVYPVLQLDLPYVRHAKRMQKVFENLGYAAEKVRWIINRYVGKEDIALADANHLLSEAFITVPNDHKAVVTSVNQGIPVTVVNHRSPVAKALLEWATRLVPDTEQKGGWLRLFRHESSQAAD